MRLRILIAGLIFGAAVFAAETGADLFQRAVTAERAAGNLEEAIKLYERVAREFASDRALAAKALVQEARCYEKLGQDKAVKLYEQVARDYRDQREPATTANARLAALRKGERAAAPAGMTQRSIELPFPNTSPTDATQTDGQREVYKDTATGALMISDLAGGDKRVVFKPKPGEQVSAYLPSRDRSIVGMVLARQGGSIKGAVVKTDGTGYRELDGIDLPPSCGVDWSWDNRYLFTCGRQPDGTRQLLRVSVTDGEIRKVRATDSSYHRPSPDGRFIAIAASPDSVFGKVFVAPSQDGEPQLVSDSARLIDWTRDGRYLIVASAPAGSEALYLLPIKDGRLSGDPILVRYGPCTYGGTNADGALVYRSILPGGTYGAWLGTFDSSGRLADWKRLNLSGVTRLSIVAKWSPDSSQITYVILDESTQKWVVRLNNVANGGDRELYRGRYASCVWAAQHPSLFCGMSSLLDRAMEVFSLSVDSGRVEQLGSITSVLPYLFFASRDDRTLYFLREPDHELIQWEINTQQATSLGRIPGFGCGNGGGCTPNPDEHWMARRDKAAIEIRPTPGGNWKPLISVDPTQMGFSGDGNWLLYHDRDAAGKECLFRVATAGGQPERVGDFPTAIRRGSLNISPDGKKVVAEARITEELWLLENFEPKQPAARKAGR